MNNIGIYKITAPNSFVYIGQSRNIKQRFNQHGNDVKNRKLYESIRRYGKKFHTFEIVHELPEDVTQEIMDNYEQVYIDFYKSAGIQLLNMKDAGKFGKHSLESIEYMKGRNGMHMVGRKLSPETIEKRTAKQKGMKRSDETKARLADSKKGSNNPMFGKKPPNFGKPHSQETRNKLKEAWKKRKGLS